MYATTAIDDPCKQVQVVQQRLALASRMIERMAGKDRDDLTGELEALQARFLVGVDDMLVEDSGAFFERVTASYRKRSKATGKLDDAVFQQRYSDKLAELEMFRTSFDELVAERGDVARRKLDRQQFLARIEKAEAFAGKGSFQQAYKFADDAYHQLIEALKLVRDQETVEYRLEFESAEDEYAYEIRRFESQIMLIDMIVKERAPSQDRMDLIHQFVAQAEIKNAQAKTLAESGDYKSALSQQESAVAELNRAMRVAGIYF